jgi:hypothetical protein
LERLIDPHQQTGAADVLGHPNVPAAVAGAIPHGSAEGVAPRSDLRSRLSHPLGRLLVDLGVSRAPIHDGNRNTSRDARKVAENRPARPRRAYLFTRRVWIS